MRHPFTSILAVALLLVGSVVSAQSERLADRFSFVVPNPPESTVDSNRFHLSVHRWSTDAERDTVKKALSEQGAASLLSTFTNTPNVAYIRWPGGLDYPVRYARRTPRSDGGYDVTLITDRALWVWWKPGVDVPAGDAPYSVIQLRLDKDGKGEGRVGSTTKIAADAQHGVRFAAEAEQPLLIRDVKRESASS